MDVFLKKWLCRKPVTVAAAPLVPPRRILFLDDDPERHEAFRSAHVYDHVTYCTTAAEAIAAIDGNEAFDEIHLDHDLGGKIFVEQVEDTGFQVALHIAGLTPDRMPRKVVVHTHNISGARRMVKSLAGKCPLDYIPF